MLPCCGLLEKLSYKVIPEGQHADATTELDERLFATPAIALVKSEELAKRMAADSNLRCTKACKGRARLYAGTGRRLCPARETDDRPL